MIEILLHFLHTKWDGQNLSLPTLESVSNTTLQYNVTCFRFVLPIGIFFMSHRKSIIMKHWNFYFFVYMIIML